MFLGTSNVRAGELETIVWTCECGDPANVHPEPNSRCPKGRVKRAARLEDFHHWFPPFRWTFRAAKRTRRDFNQRTHPLNPIAEAVIRRLPRI